MPGFIQIAITVLANLMDYHSEQDGEVKRFFSIEQVSLIMSSAHYYTE